MTSRFPLSSRAVRAALPCAISLLLLSGSGGHGAEPPDAGGREGRGIDWALTFERAIEQARAERKYVMVDFFTSWCGWCRRLVSQTYSDPGVAARMSHMVAVRVDAEKDKALTGRFGVNAFPTVLFLNPDATVRHVLRGFQEPDAFLQTLDRVFATDSEQFALETRVRFDPGDAEARLGLTELMALRGEYGPAAAHLDTLLRSGWGSRDQQASLALDRYRFLIDAGNLNGLRRDLDRWVKRNDSHERWAEGVLLLATLNDRLGRIRDARRLYQRVIDSAPDSWLAQESTARLSDLPDR